MQNLKKYGRIGVCVLLVLVVFVIFELRLLEWQVFRHQEYSEDAATTGSLFVKLEATRGEILDKDGNVLAGNKTVYNVVMNALTMEKDRNPAILSALKLFKERDIEWIDRLPIEINEKGEYVCVIDLHELPEEDEGVSGISAHGLLLERLFRGMRMKDAVKEVSALPGFTRNEVYKASLEVADFLAGEEEEA